MKFGIEIEMATNRDEMEAALRQALLDEEPRHHYAVGGYRESVFPSRWEVGFDPSLKLDGHAPERCVEIKTPPFRMVGFREIGMVLKALATVPHEFTPRCGLHIHAEAKEMGPAQILRICRAVASLPEAQANHPKRRKYLQPIPPELLQLTEESVTDEALRQAWFAGYKTIPAPGRGRLHPSRRRVLNLVSYWYRGTLEFRWFPATLDVNTIREHLDLVADLMRE